MFSFAVPLQLLSLHPTSALPAQPVYLIFSELFSRSCSLCLFWKKLPNSKKKTWWRFFRKIDGLQDPNLFKWNPTISVFLGITDTAFWGIFRNSYYMNSSQITDKFCSTSLTKHGLHMAISIAMRNENTFHFLCIFVTMN